MALLGALELFLVIENEFLVVSCACWFFFNKRESRVKGLSHRTRRTSGSMEDLGLIFENCESPVKDFSTEMKFQYVMFVGD